MGQINCTASSVPPVIRAEGLAERLGDIVLRCTSTVIGLTEAESLDQQSSYLTVNVSVSLNTNVTNNRDFGPGSSVTDAILVTNENNAQTPSAESVLGGPDPRFPLPQFGVLASSTRLEWNGVLFPIPGAGQFPTTTTLRFTSIRAKPVSERPSGKCFRLHHGSSNDSRGEQRTHCGRDQSSRRRRVP